MMSWIDVSLERPQESHVQYWRSFMQGLEETIRQHQQDAGGQHQEASAALERFHKLLDSLEELEARMKDMKQVTLSPLVSLQVILT